VEVLPDAMSPRILRAGIAIDVAAANAYVERQGSPQQGDLSNKR
jgi:hypothetical protein